MRFEKLTTRNLFMLICLAKFNYKTYLRAICVFILYTMNIVLVDA